MLKYKVFIEALNFRQSTEAEILALGHSLMIKPTSALTSEVACQINSGTSCVFMLRVTVVMGDLRPTRIPRKEALALLLKEATLGIARGLKERH